MQKNPGEILNEAHDAAKAAVEVLKLMHEGRTTPEHALAVAEALKQKARELNAQYDQMTKGPRWT